MNHIDEFTLNEYLDGELDAAAIAAVSAHLDKCAACRQVMVELELVFSSLEAVADVPLTTDLAARLQPLLQDRPRLSRQSQLLLAMQAIVAVGLVVSLWPRLQPLLALGGETAVQAWTAVPWQLWWTQLQAWGSEIFTLPAAPVTPAPLVGQWGLILALALVLWLAGNRLLLPADTHEQGGRHG